MPHNRFHATDPNLNAGRPRRFKFGFFNNPPLQPKLTWRRQPGTQAPRRPEIRYFFTELRRNAPGANSIDIKQVKGV
jgi:hypothetical protein